MRGRSGHADPVGFFDYDAGYDESAWDGMFEIAECRRALSPSGLPGIDYALNPYGGCEHGCAYCYAPEVTRCGWDGWRVVKVRENIPSRLARELPGISGTIGVGTSTDPYQGAERRFRLTRSCLEIIRGRRLPVRVHTKSDIVLDDADLLFDMRAEVEVSITGIDRRSSLIVEPGAPPPEARLRALSELISRGVRAYALVEPVLSTARGREAEIAEAIASTGVEAAFIGGLNPRPELSRRLDRLGVSGSDESAGLISELLEERGVAVSDPFRRPFATREK